MRRESYLNRVVWLNFGAVCLTTIGYARVSTTDQNLEIQIAALKAAGSDVIRSENRSGSSTNGRTELQTVLDFLRKGDCLTVTRIDRLLVASAISKTLFAP